MPAYFNPHMAANILSYHKLQETHRIFYDEHQDTFSATPFMVGPVLTFICVKGHYILDLTVISQVFFSGIDLKSAKYTKRQLVAARKAYDFIIRMGFIRLALVSLVFENKDMTSFIQYIKVISRRNVIVDFIFPRWQSHRTLTI